MLQETECSKGGAKHDRWVSSFLLSSTYGACSGRTDGGRHWGAGFPCAQTPRAPPPLGEVLPVGLHRRVSHRDHPLSPALASRCLSLLAGNARLWLCTWRLHRPSLSAGIAGSALAGEAVGGCPYCRSDWVLRCSVDGLLRG